MDIQHTQCHMCHVHYNSIEHRPKILPCAHTLCKKCTHELFAQSSPVCPICDRKIDKHDAIAVTTDFAALELSTQNEKQESASGDGLGSAICQHGDSDRTLTPDSAEKENECGGFQEQAGSEGGAHIVDREILTEELMLKFDDAISASEKMRDILTAEYASLKTSSESALSDMDADFDNVIHLLNRRRQLLRQQVMSQYEEKLSTLDEDMETVTLNAMRIDCLRKHANRLMTQATSHDTQSLQNTASKIECELQELNEPLQDVSTQVYSFIYEPGSNNQNAIKLIRSHGRVKCVAVDQSRHSSSLSPSLTEINDNG